MTKANKAKKNNRAKRPTIGPATATLIVTKRHKVQIDLTLVPCSQCGRKGRVGDTPTEVTMSDGKTWSICHRFERATGKLICKQCMNEIGFSDDPAEDEKWLAKTMAYNKTALTIMRYAGKVFPWLDKLYRSESAAEDDRR